MLQAVCVCVVMLGKLLDIRQLIDLLNVICSVLVHIFEIMATEKR